MKVTFEDGFGLIVDDTPDGKEKFVIGRAIKIGASLLDEDDPVRAALLAGERGDVVGMLDHDTSIAAVHGLGQIASGKELATSDVFWSPRQTQRAAADFVTEIALAALHADQSPAISA